VLGCGIAQGKNDMPTPVRLVVMAVSIAALLAALAGCSGSEGIEQGEPVVDAVTGCPVISSRFAVVPPDRNTGVSLEGSAWSTRHLPEGGTREGVGRLESYASVQVTAHGTHAIEMRFAYPFHEVMGALEHIREHERPRYLELYRLMQPEGRADFVAKNGEAMLQKRIAELGPRTGHVVSFERNRDYTCEDGWWLFPREHLGPLRVTLDTSGALVAESKELSTYEVIAWCGDGCKGLPIPTGTYTGTMRWPADSSNSEWKAEEVARNDSFPRPADWVEAEQRDFAANNQRSAERQYARPEEVREALTPLLPDGVSMADITITTLPFKGARVRVHAVPTDPAMPVEDQRVRLEWFLAALREGDPGFIEDREVVKRLISGDGPWRHEFEIYLDTHPLVQPRAAPAAQSAGVAVLEAGSDPLPALAYVPPPVVPVASVEPPDGFATLAILESRLAAHLAAGCSIDRLNYSGGAVVMKGRAATMQCVSETMRALDGAVPMGADGRGSGIELVQIAATEEGRYTFEIRLPASPLTKA
jgi:hypothetical protein